MIDNPFTLEGKKILITGASSGIGRATAILCSKMGATIFVTGRDGQRLSETFNNLTGEGHQYYTTDLTNNDERLNLVQKLPALDGVVHCAGIWRVKLAKNLTEQDINEIMSINFNATVILQSELMVQKKISKGSSVVIMSSKAAEVPSIASSLYSATKSALQSYGKCLALELAPRNIRVNCICPARVWTPLVYSTDIEEEDLKEREKKYPLKRFGNPDDIANLAVFLLSEASSWITGSCIDITGGALEL